MSSTNPRDVFQVDSRTLGIEWQDGQRHEYDVRGLRLACSCAACVNEWTGEKMLAEEAVPSDVAPVAIESVGHYGLRIQWSDGHGTGIYTYEHLRDLGESGHTESDRSG